jgi:hypothetical protein
VTFALRCYAPATTRHNANVEVGKNLFQGFPYALPKKSTQQSRVYATITGEGRVGVPPKTPHRGLHNCFFTASLGFAAAQMSQQLPVYQIPIAVAMLLIGTALMGYCIWCLAISLRSRSWPEVEATILSATVEEVHDEGVRYSSQIAYRYCVAGRDLTSSRVRIGSQILSGSPRRSQKHVSGRCPELSCRFESVVMNIMLPS